MIFFLILEIFILEEYKFFFLHKEKKYMTRDNFRDDFDWTRFPFHLWQSNITYSVHSVWTNIGRGNGWMGILPRWFKAKTDMKSSCDLYAKRLFEFVEQIWVRNLISWLKCPYNLLSSSDWFSQLFISTCSSYYILTCFYTFSSL